MRYILRVDDDQPMIRLFGRQYGAAISAAGAKLLSALSPEVALEFVGETRLQNGDHLLAVLDFNMPEMTGLALLATLRMKLAPLDVTIHAVFYSSDPSGHNRRAVEAAGAQFLHKLDNEAKLDAIVTAFLAS